MGQKVLWGKGQYRERMEFLFSGLAKWLAGSEFPNQGLNPDPVSDSTEPGKFQNGNF